MERGPGGEAQPLRVVRRVDLQAPRQVGGPAVELLVEVVADPADGLGEEQSRRDGVGQHAQPDAVAAGVEPGAEQSTGDRPPDAESAVPHLERGHRVAALAEVEVGVRGHVVETSADQACGDGPQRDVADLPGPAAARHPALLPHPHRGDDAEDDRQGVGADRERPEVPHPFGGARDGAGQGERDQGSDDLWVHVSAFSIFSRSSAMSDWEVLAVQTRSPLPSSTEVTLAVWSTS